MNRNNFTVNVYIRELSEEWHLVAVQLKLVYNTTLLEYINATQGPFMRDPRWDLYGTYPIIIAEYNDVLLGDMILPNGTGYWDQIEFPNDEGLVFSIEFKPLYFAPATDELTIEPLNDMFFMGVDENPIPYNAPVNGTYQTNYERIVHTISYPPTTFTVVTVSDKLVSTIIFNQTGGYLHFNVTQYYSWEGFVNVTIPKNLMWLVNPLTDEWVVLVNDTSVTPIVSENSTHTTLKIPLNFADTANVHIFSTGIIPEYALPALMTIFLVLTLVALVMSKRLHHKTRP
jgi:hypothetical protein